MTNPNEESEILRKRLLDIERRLDAIEQRLSAVEPTKNCGRCAEYPNGLADHPNCSCPDCSEGWDMDTRL